MSKNSFLTVWIGCHHSYWFLEGVTDLLLNNLRRMSQTSYQSISEGGLKHPPYWFWEVVPDLPSLRHLWSPSYRFEEDVKETSFLQIWGGCLTIWRWRHRPPNNDFKHLFLTDLGRMSQTSSSACFTSSSVFLSDNIWIDTCNTLWYRMSNAGGSL